MDRAELKMSGDWREKTLIVKKQTPEQQAQPGHILCSEQPLVNWSIKQNKQSRVTKLHDEYLEAGVLQLLGNDSCYLDYPAKQLDSTASYPCCVFILKTLLKPFSIDFSVEDSGGLRRRLMLNTEIETSSIKNFTACLPMKVHQKDWQHMHINFNKLTKQLFNAQHARTLKIRVYPNCQLYRIYFTRSTREGENVLI